MENHMVRQGEDQDKIRCDDRSEAALSIGLQALLATLFVMGFIFLAVQTAKLAYQGWFEIKGLVLEEFDASVKVEDLSKYSLAELTARYLAALKAVQDFENDENTPEVEMNRHNETEPYATEERLKGAIQERESHRNRLHELRYYCLLGVGMIVAGTLFFTRLNRVIGISLLITGFGEMIGYTAPHSWDSSEYYTIQATKLGFSCLAMLLLFLAAYATGVFSVARGCCGQQADESAGLDQK